ncbi:uncharacterized protein FYW61_016295 isoform 2-T2 [Anableps anableps]
MPSTMILKPKPADAPRKSGAARPTAARSGADTEPRAAAVRKTRTSSCSRSAQPRDKSQRGPAATAGAQGSKPSCERRARSTSAAPKPTGSRARTEPERRRATSSARLPDANPREGGGCPGLKDLRVPGAGGKAVIQSNKAFTVIPPNPKKRREIQKKAEAELAALEELRLSRAMAYVSINPSSVGGCMSLEEVRLKQQQEMMQAKRKQKQVRKQVMEETPVLTR